jgi:trimethylamine-N-oxide reductase (cytochrome c)
MMVCDTSTWKHHSMFSDVPWTREIEKVIGFDGYAYAPVWIHPEDAAPRGIKDGDIVRVFNDQGGVLGGAVVNHLVRPGAIRFEKAGGGHHLIPGVLHQGGNPNTISPKTPMSLNAYGQATIGYLVQVEKVTPDMMAAWLAQNPAAAKRLKESYDPAFGPIFNGWVEGDSQTWQKSF